MKVIILPVSLVGDYDSGFGGELAIMSHKNTSIVLDKYIAEVKRLSEKFSPQLMELVMFDGLSVVSLSAVKRNVNEKTYAKIEAAVEEREPIIVSMKEAEFLEIEQEEERIECVQLHVELREVWWSFYPKHASLSYETAQFPTKKLVKRM
jgi:hypothetical protein